MMDSWVFLSDYITKPKSDAEERKSSRLGGMIGQALKEKITGEFYTWRKAVYGKYFPSVPKKKIDGLLDREV